MTDFASMTVAVTSEPLALHEGRRRYGSSTFSPWPVSFPEHRADNNSLPMSRCPRGPGSASGCRWEIAEKRRISNIAVTNTAEGIAPWSGTASKPTLSVLDLAIRESVFEDPPPIARLHRAIVIALVQQSGESIDLRLANHRGSSQNEPFHCF
jgi:hypothetical protein